MGRPDHHSPHHVADFIPQSVLQPRHYGLQIATYPARRFIEPARDEQRALVLIPANRSREGAPSREFRLACLAIAVAFAVILYFIVPLLIGP